MPGWSIDESLDDWFSLRRNGLYPGGSSIEGEASEWRAIAAAIEAGGAVAHKRCAVQVKSGSVVLWSPRNCAGQSDRSVLTLEEGVALVLEIRRVLDEHAARPPRTIVDSEDEA